MNTLQMLLIGLIFGMGQGTVVAHAAEVKLTANDAAAQDYFGNSVSIDGDYAIVGAWKDDHAGGTDAGSAYIFVRSGETWAQQTKLTARDAGTGTVCIVSGSGWRVTDVVQTGWDWTRADLDDSGWETSVVVSHPYHPHGVLPGSDAVWMWGQSGARSIWFRKTFEIASVHSAQIAISVDDEYDLFVNGELVGQTTRFNFPGEIYDITSKVRPGANVIALRAQDLGVKQGVLLEVVIFETLDAAAEIRRVEVPPGPEGTFTDVTFYVGVVGGGSGRGIAFLDYDADGDLDLFVTNDYEQYSILNRNDGERGFTNVTFSSGVARLEHAHGIACGDYDNDGDPDLYIVNIRGYANRLLRNDGDGTFSDVTSTAGVGLMSQGRSASFLDYDNDGHLDLYVVNQGKPNVLYRNNGDGTFRWVTAFAGVGDMGEGISLAVGDFDDDGDGDLYIVNWKQPNVLYRNNGDGTFTDVGSEAGVGDDGEGAGATFGDYDNDGDLDLYLPRLEQPDRLYRNNGDGTFSDVSGSAGLLEWRNAVAFGDYDNDGDLDLYVVSNGTRSPSVLYRNNGDGTFSDVTSSAGVGDAGEGVAASFGDYDNDGDLDLYVTDNRLGDADVLYRNNGAPGNWLDVKLVGVRSTRDGIGARVTLISGGCLQMREKGAGSGLYCGAYPLLHFGLGENAEVDSLVVCWPSGIVQVLTDIAANQLLTIAEPEEGKPVAGGIAQVRVSDIYGEPGVPVILAIEVDDGTGMAGADMVLTYDPSLLTLTDVETTDLTSGLVVTWNEEPSGTVTIALAGTSEIAGGSGDLIELTFEVSEGAPLGMVSRVRFRSCTLWDVKGDAIPSTTQDGAVIVLRIAASIPDTSALLGASMTVPINVDDASGIAGANIDIGYDATVLTIGEITVTDLSQGLMLTANTTEPGVVRIALAGATGIAGGSGALVNIGFQVAESAIIGTVVPLRFLRLDLRDELGEEIGAQSVDGSLTVTGIPGDLNGDGNVNSGDAILVLRISVGLLTPTPNQQWAGDVYEDGEINSGDAILILRKAVGLPSFKRIPLAKALAQVEVSVSDAIGSPGEKSVVWISVSEAEGIAGGDLVLTYNPDVLTAREVKGTALAAGLVVVSNTSTPGEVKISLAGATGLPGGSGSLLEMIFDVREDAEAGRASPLRLTEVTLRDETGDPLSLGTISDGTFTVDAVSVEAREAMGQPISFALSQNVPNPFNAATDISYQLPKRGFVRLTVYDLSGQLLRTLVEEEQRRGYYVVRWDGRDSSGKEGASGIYLYRLQAHTGLGREDFTQTRRMILLR